MSTNQYQEMRNRQQAEINAFPMFFAFKKQQFAEGMRTLGLSLSDTCQMCSIFGGGYCRKSDAAKLDKMAYVPIPGTISPNQSPTLQSMMHL